jgi:alpha-mannosidase
VRKLAVVLLLLSSFAAAQSSKAPDPYKPVLDRLQAITLVQARDWRWHADVPHPETPELNDSAWEMAPFNKIFNDGPRVLRQTITVPDKLSGYDLRGARIQLELRVTSDKLMQIAVFSNGSLVARGDEDQQQPVTLTEDAQPGQKFVVAVRVGSIPGVGTRVYRSQLLITPTASRPDPEMLRLEIRSAEPMVAAFAQGKAEHQQVLDAAVKAIDLGALDRGDQAAFDNSLLDAQQKLGALNPWLKSFTIRATGNSHIDMAWLWPWTETVEVVRNTFQSALDLMREYPDFTFTMSSARAYAWMEDKYPDLFKEIQQRVKEGRWEVIGGMWVEPDLNLPDGESLTRQILIGKRYFQQKFGVDIKIGYNPDSFGYNWQLPQIYKRSGMDYFVTQKIYWNDTTKFPYKLFWWEAPDGSRLLTYFPHDYANSIDPVRMAADLSVYAPAMNFKELMHLYGVGDHGGGPTRSMLDTATRFMDPKLVYPAVKFGTALGYFEDLNRNLSTLNVPTWKDELYLEYHRGVQTTQAETKRRIRETEELLEDTEKFASMAHLFGTGAQVDQPAPGPASRVCCEAWTGYPQQQLEDAWKKLLFDQFHDIMPGSGIAVNYADALKNLQEARRSAREVQDAALKEIAAHVNTRVAQPPSAGVPVLIFNPLSWQRRDLAEFEVQMPAPVHDVEVSDAGGKPVQSQVLASDAKTNRVRLLVFASVPALGYATYFVRPGAPAKAADPVTASDTTLENGFLRVKVDRKTGCMTSIFDKRTHTEALGEPAQPPLPYETKPYPGVCGNLLQAFVDKPKDWDAWNIDADFEKQRTDLMQPDEVKLVENGPLRYVLRVRQHFGNSQFVQDITMYPGLARVDVHMSADWHEKHILLKVAFPLSAHNDQATYEIPYGSIERPTTRNTPAEQAKFEVPALRWADLSDATHGFSLLNDSKYGYDARGNVLRLSLLRSPTWPDPHADEGHHEFMYSLLPHARGWKDGPTMQQAYDLNYPLIALATDEHAGELPAEHSFASTDAPNVVITAVKKAEDDGSVIFRFYEWAGKQTDVRLKLPRAAQSAEQTNLMEKPEAPLALEAGGTQVVAPTGPYEIKTVKVTFATSK